MAINNRDLNTPQQRDTYNTVVVAATATGATLVAALVPYPAAIDAASVVSPNGISGTPTVNLEVLRFNSIGVTTIGSIASTFLVLGATLSFGMTMFTGASLVQLQTGDVVVARLGGTNSSLFPNAVVSLALRALQDVKTSFGN